MTERCRSLCSVSSGHAFWPTVAQHPFLFRFRFLLAILRLPSVTNVGNSRVFLFKSASSCHLLNTAITSSQLFDLETMYRPTRFTSNFRSTCSYSGTLPGPAKVLSVSYILIHAHRLLKPVSVINDRWRHFPTSPALAISSSDKAGVSGELSFLA